MEKLLSLISPALKDRPGRLSLKQVFIICYAPLALAVPSFYFLSQWMFVGLLSRVTFWREIPILFLPLCYFFLFKDERPRLARSPVVAISLIFVVGIVHLLVGQISAAILIRGLVAYFLIFWSLLFFRSLKTENLMLFLLGSTFLCLVGGIGVIVDHQFQTFRYIVLAGSVEERLATFSDEGYRPAFLFEAATMGCFILTVATGLQVYVFKYFENRLVRAISALSSICSIAAILLSLARVGYAGLAVMASGVVISAIVTGKLRFLLWSACAGVFIFVAIQIINSEESDLGLRLTKTFTGQASDDQSNIERVDSWKDGLDALERRPILGAGIGTGQVRAVHEAPAHYESSILAVANEGGVFTLVMFLALFFVPLCQLIRSLRRIFTWDMTVYSIFFMLALLLMSFINPIFSLPDYSIYLGFIYVLMIRISRAEVFSYSKLSVRGSLGPNSLA